jgi:hypothetical protein
LSKYAELDAKIDITLMRAVKFGPTKSATD